MCGVTHYNTYPIMEPTKKFNFTKPDPTIKRNLFEISKEELENELMDEVLENEVEDEVLENEIEDKVLENELTDEVLENEVEDEGLENKSKDGAAKSETNEEPIEKEAVDKEEVVGNEHNEEPSEKEAGVTDNNKEVSESKKNEEAIKNEVNDAPSDKEFDNKVKLDDEDEDGCEDLEEDCESRNLACNNPEREPEYQIYSMIRCRKSCNMCGKKLPCLDAVTPCNTEHHCNSDEHRIYCRKTCGLC